MDDMNQKQFKAFLLLLLKDLERIQKSESKEELKEQLNETIEAIKLMIAD